MNFIKGLSDEFNQTTTENGAKAYKSTSSKLLDLFGIIGSLRNRIETVENKFAQAFAEDATLALKMAFYTRDIRGGLGERAVFREILKYLAKVYPVRLKYNLELIPEYGRWDDLFVLLGTNLEDDVINIIKNQLAVDWISKTPSLMAKWLPSSNASSKETKKNAKKIIKKLNCPEKEYRKILTRLRAKIKIVETSMSQNKWNEIEYSHVPSRAMNIYRNAFKKHDEDRFNQYIEDVSKGESKINSSTLYPYDIIEKMNLNGWSTINVFNYDKVLEEQWKALPNYLEGENNILVMADTSASMQGRPLATALGLAIYFAQRNKGMFKNNFMTFSEKPEFIQFQDNMTLYDIINGIPSIVANTNIEAAFNKILNVAIKNKINKSEMPKSLIIISDMEFDQGVNINSNYSYYEKDQYNSLFKHIVQRYNNHGYEMPNVVFWNVDSRNDVYQVSSGYCGVQLASGQSPSVFKSILNNIGKTPYEAMLNVLNSERYKLIK